MRKSQFGFSLLLAVFLFSFFNIQPARAQYLAIEAPDLEILGNTDVTAGTTEMYILQATLRNNQFPVQTKWSSSNPRIASISSNGVLTTAYVKQECDIEVTAEIPWYNEILSATQTITIYPSDDLMVASAAKPKPLRLRGLTLSGSTSLENGTSTQLTLSAKYSDGNIVDVANAANWTVTPAESATISAGFLSINNSNPKTKKVTVTAAFLNTLNGKMVTKKKTVKIIQSTPPPPPPAEPLTIVSWGFLPSSPKTTGRNQSNVPIYAGATYSDGSFRIISGLYTTQWASENTLLGWFPNPPGPIGGMFFTGNNSGQVWVNFRHLYQNIFYTGRMPIQVQ